MPSLETVLQVVALVGIAGALFLAVLATARSTPNRVIRAVQDLENRVLTAERNVESLRSAWTAFIEDAEGILQSVETKRRRIAAAESKLKGSSGNGEIDLNDPMALTRRARELGYNV